MTDNKTKKKTTKSDVKQDVKPKATRTPRVKKILQDYEYSNERDSLPAVFVKSAVLFPNNVLPLFVAKNASIASLDFAFINGFDIAIFTHKNQEGNPTLSTLYKIGVRARVLHISKSSDGSARVLLEIKNRLEVQSFVSYRDSDSVFAIKHKRPNDINFSIAVFKDIKNPKDAVSLKIQRLRKVIVSAVTEMSKINPFKITEESLGIILKIENNDAFFYAIAISIEADTKSKQKLLECASLEDGFEELYKQLCDDLAVMHYDQEINSKLREKIKNDQKKFYLNEQKRIIEKELHEISPKDDGSEYSKYLEIAETKKLPKEVVDKIKEEINRVKNLSYSSEAGITKAYLDFLTALPWGIASDDNLDLGLAQNILNLHHYGLDKIKDRILEYIAIKLKSKSTKGQILCLYGPPGVGKTSLAKSIAEAMGKKYVKISLGGLRDEAEIRGHRKTYIGAFAGKILTSLKRLNCDNPVILLDEIDKMGMNSKGDPVSALLEVLDPEQNNQFSDHYLEVPYDVSSVTFIATANSLDIPRPLLDRMEIINVSGYTESEKLHICKQYIVQKVFNESGIDHETLSLSNDAILNIIRYYTSESGVRELERQVKKIAGKFVKDLVFSQKNYEPKVIDTEELHYYLGIKRFKFGIAEETSQVGVVTGLAYTQMGGDVLKIEAIKSCINDKAELKTTGKLGDVIKESVMAAYSYIQSRAGDYNIDPEMFKKYSVHIHFPEGATPKDGPSAGTAISLALLSLFTNKQVRKDIGLTGEITLTGKVLPIGGLKEKLNAALRAGLTTVFIPKDNIKDLEEIPMDVKDNLIIIPVDSIDAITKIAFV
jgi:ATP-dependent Lon protease